MSERGLWKQGPRLSEMRYNTVVPPLSPPTVGRPLVPTLDKFSLAHGRER